MLSAASQLHGKHRAMRILAAYPARNPLVLETVPGVTMRPSVRLTLFPNPLTIPVTGYRRKPATQCAVSK